jgi:hypothetical protein
MARLVFLCAFTVVSSGCESHVPKGFWDRTQLSSDHVASCDDPGCGNGDDVPVGGPHCGAPLACRVYTEAQNRCHWVHNLEHGHAVLLYNCPEGCPDDLAALQRHYDAELPHRIVVAPEPSLPGRIAALVWGHGWLGDAYDKDAVNTILLKQDVDAPEAGLACGT